MSTVSLLQSGHTEPKEHEFKQQPPPIDENSLGSKTALMEKLMSHPWLSWIRRVPPACALDHGEKLTLDIFLKVFTVPSDGDTADL